MRPRTCLVLLVMVVGVTLGLPASSRATVTAAANAPIVRRASVAMTATDSGTPLQVCDPSAPESGFSVENAQFATLSGFPGTIYQGELINHCTVAASHVALVALFSASDGSLVGKTTLEPNFGLIGPGGGSPFIAINPVAPAQVARVLLVAARFIPVTAATAQLVLTKGAATVQADGVSVPYSVRNAGSAAASLPHISGRLLGADCSAPLVSDYLQQGSPIAVGASVTGTLFIHGSCAGVPDVEAGSDAPIKAGLPPGLSFAEVRTFYSADGVLHLIANVCNNGTQESLLPQFRVQFTGPATVAFTLNESGIYSGLSCAPLIAAIAGAPAGLTFDRLLTATGQQSAEVEVPARADEEIEMAITLKVLDTVCTKADQQRYFVFNLRPSDDRCYDALLTLKGNGKLIPGEFQVDVDLPAIVTFLYNNTDSALASSAYRVQSLGHGEDGALVGGIDVSNPPSLDAHSWGIGVTPMDANSVIVLESDTFIADGEGFAIPK